MTHRQNSRGTRKSTEASGNVIRPKCRPRLNRHHIEGGSSDKVDLEEDEDDNNYEQKRTSGECTTSDRHHLHSTDQKVHRHSNDERTWKRFKRDRRCKKETSSLKKRIHARCSESLLAFKADETSCGCCHLREGGQSRQSKVDLLERNPSVEFEHVNHERQFNCDNDLQSKHQQHRANDEDTRNRKTTNADRCQVPARLKVKHPEDSTEHLRPLERTHRTNIADKFQINGRGRKSIEPQVGAKGVGDGHQKKETNLDDDNEDEAARNEPFSEFYEAPNERADSFQVSHHSKQPARPNSSQTRAMAREYHKNDLLANSRRQSTNLRASSSWQSMAKFKQLQDRSMEIQSELTSRKTSAPPLQVTAPPTTITPANNRRSMVSQFTEGFFFKEPHYENQAMDLNHNLAYQDTSNWESSEQDDDDDDKEDEVRIQGRTTKKKNPKAIDEDKDFERVNEQATGGFGDSTFKFKHEKGPNHRKHSGDSRKRTSNRPPPLLERQPRAILSSYELSSPPMLISSTPQRHQSNDDMLSLSRMTSTRTDVAKKDIERTQQTIKREPAIAITTIQQSKRRPKFGYLPFTSFSFGTTTTTTTTTLTTDARTSSAFSDTYDAISDGISDDKLATTRSSAERGLGRARPQNRPARLLVENLKFMVERNLVASLIGVYIVLSLVIMIVLMMPYVFNINQSSAPATPTGLAAQMGFEVASTPNKESNSKLDGPKSSPQRVVVLPVLPSGERSRAIDGKNSNPKTNAPSNSLHKQQVPPPSPPSSPPPVIQQQQLQAEDLARKQRLLARLSELRAEARIRENENLHEMWRVVHKRPCQPLKVPFCSRSIDSMLTTTGQLHTGQSPDTTEATIESPGLAYDRTLLPNQFTKARQSQVEWALEQYEPLVDVRCYPLMPLFLCSIYAPKCVSVNASSPLVINRKQPHATVDQTLAVAGGGGPEQSAPDFVEELFPSSPSPQLNRTSASNEPHWARLVPPCRSLCKEAFRRCSFFLEVLSLKLFSLEDCNSLPESADANVCVGQYEQTLLQRRHDNHRCRDDEFKCSVGGACIPKRWHCDGFNDCKDKSDEQNCSLCDDASQFYCGHDVCIDRRQVCDGRIDCKDGRDERLCIRLASSPSEQSNKRGLRRLETWNSSLSSWLPVCGAKWQATLMSHEACQALGYSRANETLILFGQDASSVSFNKSRVATKSSRSLPGQSHDSCTKIINGSAKSPPSTRGVSLASELPAVAATDVGSSLSDANLSAEAGSGKLKLNSIAWLLNSGPQTACEGEAAHLSSTVHLQCYNFQCGLSIANHLSRLSAQHHQQQQFTLSKHHSIDDRPGVRSLVDKHRSQKHTAGYDDDGDDDDDYDGDSNLMSLSNDEEILPAKDEDYDSAFIQQDVRQLDRETTTNPFISRDSLNDRKDSVNYASNSPVSSRLVVGGIESMPGEFPYLAALHGGPDEVFFCGGVLISSNWLLTAAHCVGNRTRPDGWMVKVGVTRRIASPAFVKELQVKKIIKHHAFNHGTHLNNDIALILMDNSVEFNQYLRPICLPASNLRLGPDNSKDCVVVGFGKSRFSQDANYLHVAHFVNVPIIHKSICADWYAEHNVNLTSGMLCAGYSEGKRDACQGDSGSGLFCRYSNTNQFYVAGVVSFGIKCAKPRLPGVYTSVPSYADWIKETTRENGFPIP